MGDILALIVGAILLALLLWGITKMPRNNASNGLPPVGTQMRRRNRRR